MKRLIIILMLFIVINLFAQVNDEISDDQKIYEVFKENPHLESLFNNLLEFSNALIQTGWRYKDTPSEELKMDIKKAYGDYLDQYYYLIDALFEQGVTREMMLSTYEKWNMDPDQITAKLRESGLYD